MARGSWRRPTGCPAIPPAEPRRLRLRLLSAPGKLSRHARELRLRLAAAWLWADDLAAAIIRLQELPNPR